jgi:hypothetical protein
MSYRNIFVLLALAFVVSSVHAQSKEDKIKAIRQTFEQTNKDHTLTNVTLDAEDFLSEAPDNGGKLTGYFKRDSLCKLSVEIGVSYAIRRYDYYYSHGRPVFIYETEESFARDSAGNMNYHKKALNFEGRYYLDNGAVIDIKPKGKKLMEDKVDPAYIHELVTDADTYSRLLYKQHKK